MHFVGNRAIVLGDGEKEIQLYYSPTYTAVSAVLPIIVIFPGFLVGDRFYKGSRSTSTRYLAMIVCGVLTGASVTEMHYLGNQGTTDYILKPRLGFIIGAATIAIGACCLAFGLFFHWAGHWMNTLWRRLIVSCFLAGAVSGMHWTAAAGTSYELRGYHQGAGTDRNVTLIIALCLVSWLHQSRSRLVC
jgi:NO-binding membrane sensor protein with MHYT domain